MKLIKISMGCLSSRSTVSPADKVESSSGANGSMTNGGQRKLNSSSSDRFAITAGRDMQSGGSAGVNYGSDMRNNKNSNRRQTKQSVGSSFDAQDDDIISILMNDSEVKDEDMGERGNRIKESQNDRDIESQRDLTYEDRNEVASAIRNIDRPRLSSSNRRSNDDDSLLDELNIDLLRQYIVVDYEINQLEEKGALRSYHEKIDKLEQLEHELDMISIEAAEVANRKIDKGAKRLIGTSNDSDSISNDAQMPKSRSQSNTNVPYEGQQQTGGSPKPRGRASTSYSMVEEVFERKILLEKERDKLKKEVEQTILECDKLQQRDKKRDEILDKLFDGRTGNGLENHLEQQLNWLLEQKHYVDQVFYAWKRAETLTSQTCEQFASAMELLKRMANIQDQKESSELAKRITNLLVKSRQDMEQAQRYNPNVDAPFFTDNETKRFDKIIETISSNSIAPSELNQIITVLQFAYKRAVSIRYWLEQILETTIARDSFELAEEFKWIAIQLRKERISILKSKLQKQPYALMAQQIQESLSKQQAIDSIAYKGDGLASSDNVASNDITGSSGNTNVKSNGEINRDSGIDSETNDIEVDEEIYRILEQNKSLYDLNGTQTNINPNTTRADQNQQSSSPAEAQRQKQRDQMMLERIERRVRNGANEFVAPKMPDLARENEWNQQVCSAGAQSKFQAGQIKIDFDEEWRRNLLKQIDEDHSRHKNKIKKVRGVNRAKVSDSVVNKMQARDLGTPEKRIIEMETK